MLYNTLHQGAPLSGGQGWLQGLSSASISWCLLPQICFYEAETTRKVLHSTALTMEHHHRNSIATFSSEISPRPHCRLPELELAFCLKGIPVLKTWWRLLAVNACFFCSYPSHKHDPPPLATSLTKGSKQGVSTRAAGPDWWRCFQYVESYSFSLILSPVIFRHRILVTQVNIVMPLATPIFHMLHHFPFSISQCSSHCTKSLFLNTPGKRKTPLMIYFLISDDLI